MPSFDERFNAVVASTRRPLTSLADVAAVSASLLALQREHCRRFKSAWDLARLSSSVVRCSLANGDGGAPLCTELRSLLATAMYLCPCSVCVDLSLALKTGAYHALTLTKAAALAAALTSDTSGVQTMLSLLTLWHRLEGHAGCQWEAYAALSVFVGEGIALLAPGAAAAVDGRDGAGGATCVYTQSWVSNVLDYGLRQTQCASAVVRLLALCRGSRASAFAAVLEQTPSSALLRRQWQALQRAVLAEGRAPIARYGEMVRSTWESVVQPVLRRAFAHEPPPLSELFFAAPLLTESDCGRLLGDAIPALTAAACHDDLETVFRRLDEVREGSALLAAAGAAVTADDYTRLVRPVVAVALRTGRVAQAESLLAWVSSGLHGSVDDEGETSAVEAWRRRLRASLDGEDLSTAGDADQSGRALEADRTPMTVEHLSVDTTLDVLTTSDDLASLRAVLDASFLSRREPDAPRDHRDRGPRAALADPLAPTFITKALAKLLHLLLNRGDVAQARPYLTRLALCVMACPSRDGLLLLLQALARVGLAFTADGCLVGHPRGGDAAHQQWSLISRCLRPALPADPPAHYRLGRVRWQAYDQRRSRKGEGRRRPWGDATVAHVTLEGGDVVLERHWHWAVRGPARAVLRLVDGRKAFEALLAQMRAAVGANRLQLQQGNTTECAAAEAALAASAKSSGPPAGGDDADAASAEALGRRRARKLVWWRERYALDAEVFTVVERLEEALGLVGVSLFLGEPAPPLQDPYWALAGELVRALASDAAYEAIREVLLAGDDRFHALCYSTLLAVPYLACGAHADEGRDDSASEEPHLRVRYAFRRCLTLCPRARVTVGLDGADSPADSRYSCNDEHCLCRPGAWHRVSRGLAMAVEELLVLAFRELGDPRERLPPQPSPSPPSTAPGCRCDADELCERMARAAIALTLGQLPDNGSKSVDLLQLPRQHTYLLLDNALHALPMEGLRTLRQRSCSRILSAGEAGGATAPRCSLSKTHFLLDSSAVAARDAVRKLLAHHPHWTVECHDTAAEGADSITSKDLLQRFSEGQCSCYVYLGHKRGEAFLSARQLYSRPRPSLGNAAEGFPGLVMLMGCSSARVVGGEGVACFGMPCAYLHAGALSFVGCLWEITDGEVDKLTTRFLKLAVAALHRAAEDTATKAAPSLTVGEALAAARGVCKLPCLSAIAAVFYGVNSHLDM